MTHENLLDVRVLLQSLRNWANLFICKHILDEVEVSEWKKLEEVGKCLSTNLVVVDVNVTEFLLVLEHLDQLLGALIVIFVVRELYLLNCIAHGDEFADLLAANGADPIVGETQNMQALLLLVGQGLDHD